MPKKKKMETEKGYDGKTQKEGSSSVSASASSLLYLTNPDVHVDEDPEVVPSVVDCETFMQKRLNLETVYFQHSFHSQSKKGNKWPRRTEVACMHCCHPFDTVPIPIPRRYDEKRKLYYVYGNFCSVNCAKAYIREHNRYMRSVNMYYFVHMCRKVFGIRGTHTPALPRVLLKMFGGDLTIEKFRKDFSFVDVIQTEPPFIPNEVNFKKISEFHEEEKGQKKEKKKKIRFRKPDRNTEKETATAKKADRHLSSTGSTNTNLRKPEDSLFAKFVLDHERQQQQKQKTKKKKRRIKKEKKEEEQPTSPPPPTPKSPLSPHPPTREPPLSVKEKEKKPPSSPPPSPISNPSTRESKKVSASATKKKKKKKLLAAPVPVEEDIRNAWLKRIYDERVQKKDPYQKERRKDIWFVPKTNILESCEPFRFVPPAPPAAPNPPPPHRRPSSSSSQRKVTKGQEKKEEEEMEKREEKKKKKGSSSLKEKNLSFEERKEKNNNKNSLLNYIRFHQEKKKKDKRHADASKS